MDYNIVTLEIADLIVHFDYFDRLVTGNLKKSAEAYFEEQSKIRNKNAEHLTRFFAGISFYNTRKQLHPLAKMKNLIIGKLEGMKTKEVHELVEKLAKDAKKMKKLYLSIAKNK